MDVLGSLVFASDRLISVSAECVAVAVDDAPIFGSGAASLALIVPEVGSLTLLYQVSLSAEAGWAGGEGVCLPFWAGPMKPQFCGVFG